MEFSRAIAPERAIGIHDGQVNQRATTSIGRWLTERGSAAYEWIEPGHSL